MSSLKERVFGGTKKGESVMFAPGRGPPPARVSPNVVKHIFERLDKLEKDVKEIKEALGIGKPNV